MVSFKQTGTPSQGDHPNADLRPCPATSHSSYGMAKAVVCDGQVVPPREPGRRCFCYDRHGQPSRRGFRSSKVHVPSQLEPIAILAAVDAAGQVRWQAP